MSDEGTPSWPCRKCGRNKDETCNGFGLGDYCPHGRVRASMLHNRWPKSYAACQVAPGADRVRTLATTKT